MNDRALRALAAELCQVFLGWRLREDEEALLAFGEGHLTLDLLSGEAWCDGDPLPPLFIAGELARRVETEAPGLREARLEAAFATRPPGLAGPRKPTLQISCACTLVDESGAHRFEARRDQAAE